MTPELMVTSGDVRLAVYRWGPRPTADRPCPTVVLIHGYPDNAEVWRDVAEELAGHCQVVAYDVRGAGRSSAPTRTEDYAFTHLSADLRAVIDAVSPDCPVHLAGFDWGALQGWEALLSGALAGRVASWSAATPPLDHLGHWFAERLTRPTPRGLAQVAGRVLGSSYMLMFQLPMLPELTWRLGMDRLWPHVVARLEGLPAQGSSSLRADAIHGLGLYRSNLLPPLRNPRQRHTDIPVLLLVMTRDPFVPAALFAGLDTVASRLQRAEFNAGHWWPRSQPQTVARRIADFIVAVEGD